MKYKKSIQEVLAKQKISIKISRFSIKIIINTYFSENYFFLLQKNWHSRSWVECGGLFGFDLTVKYLIFQVKELKKISRMFHWVKQITIKK